MVKPSVRTAARKRYGPDRTIGIMRVLLEDRSECGDGLLDALSFSSCHLIPR